MGWTHVQSSGAQTSSASNHTLTATFSGAVAAGDLIVVSGGWYGNPGTPTVADNVNAVNYTYKGPATFGADNLGTWYYVTPKGALPGTFTITFTVPGTGNAYPAMAIDEFNYAVGATYTIDSSGTNTSSPTTSISLASALTVSGTDLIYAAGLSASAGVTMSAGSGFTLAYNEPNISGKAFGIAAEYLFPETSNINPTMSCSAAGLVSLNGIAFTAVMPVPATLEQVCVVYPKTAYTWTDRMGVKVPDVTGPLLTTGLAITGTANAGTLVVAADGTAMSMSIGVAVVLWDERGNPISVNSGTIMLSGWCKNAAGNYIAANGYGVTPPGFLAIDVSLAAGYTVLVQSIIPSGSVNLHTKLF